MGPAAIIKFVNKRKLSPQTESLIESGLKNKKLLEQELELIEKYKITLLTFLDKDYPELLKQIYLPPIVIYCSGAPLKPTAKRIAIVGARKADSYANNCISEIVPNLVKSNWEIVSGGAAGVDGMAHHQTLQNKGTTIAVFGSGLTCPYPSVNKEMFRTIARNNGTLISPFPLRTEPCKGNFPARNRIIAGLSQGCLVVQAAKKSGSLITSQFALDQGRQVFACPGQITNELSLGCHKLIQQGAKLVTCSNDILEEFGESQENGLKVTEKKLDPILKHLQEPTSIDELTNKTGLELAELQSKLFSLQLEGKVSQSITGLWQSKIF